MDILNMKRRSRWVTALGAMLLFNVCHYAKMATSKWWCKSRPTCVPLNKLGTYWAYLILALVFIPSVGYSKSEQIAFGVKLHTESTYYILEIDLTKANLHLILGEDVSDNPIYKYENYGTDAERASFGGKNPRYKGQKLHQFKLPDGKTPIAISSALFGGRWTKNYSSGNLVFPVRINGNLVTEGYGDPEGPSPEVKDKKKIRVFCFDNKTGTADIYNHYRLDKKQKCPYELVSFSKDDSKGVAEKTFVGVADKNNDGSNETVFIFTSKRRNKTNEKSAHQKLIDFGASSTIHFDGGGSSQLWIKGSYKSYSGRPLWNALVIGPKMCDSFTDVPKTDDEICNAVKFLKQEGIASANPKFSPQKSLKRGEMAKFLSLSYLYKKGEKIKALSNEERKKLLEKQVGNYKSAFSDIKDSIFNLYIKHIEKLGLASENETFRPDDKLTRAEMAKFLVLLNNPKFKPDSNAALKGTFGDVSYIEKNEKGEDKGQGDLAFYIEELYSQGLTKGCKSDKNPPDYCPTRSVIRSEMARFLYRLLEKKPKTISQGQKIPHNKEIAKGESIKAVVKWPGSDIDIVVTTPSGVVLTPESDIVKDFYEGPTEEYYVIEANETGSWKFTLIGVDIPEPEPYTFNITFGPHDVVKNYELNGQMLDESGNPVANAIVKIGEKTTIADERGYWKISELPTGTYTVIISKDGKLIASQNVTVEGDKPTLYVNIDLLEPASCRLYAVHDEGRNHSLFFTIDVLNSFDVKLLGTMYHEHDIESLAIHPTTNQLFAAAGKDGLDPGYLYTVNANTGAISPIGDTGFRDINGLSFKPDDGTLWGWAKGEGLIEIDIATAQGTLQAPYNGAIEDITWNNAGSILYAVRNNRFLAYDTHTVTVLNCTVKGGEIEAIEMMPTQADNELLFSMHNDNSLTIRSLNVDSCEQAQVTISTALEDINLNDVEGIALPKAACIP